MDSGNSTSKLDSIEDLGLLNLSIQWFINMGEKHVNHVIKMDLVFCKSVDFEFFNQAKFSFSEKLEVYVA